MLRERKVVPLAVATAAAAALLRGVEGSPIAGADFLGDLAGEEARLLGDFLGEVTLFLVGDFLGEEGTALEGDCLR